MQFDVGVIPFGKAISTAIPEFLFGGVVEVAGFSAHELAEEEVDSVQNPRAAPEILAENNFGRILIPVSVIERISILPFQKKFRACLAESVDGLLDVADHKQIVFILRERAEKAVLRAVDILALINQNFVKLFTEFMGKGGWNQIRRCRVFYQKLQCQKFRVRKVKGVSLCFGGSVKLVQLLDRFHQFFSRFASCSRNRRGLL